jgi:hypothetical protein
MHELDTGGDQKMIRTRFARIIVTAAALAALAVASSSAALAQEGVGIKVGPGPLKVDKNYRYTFDLTCPASPESTPCEGILSANTASAIKPYRTLPKKVWIVGAFPYKAQAGQTVKVPGRVLGGGAAQLALTGSVKIRVQIVNGGAVVGTQLVTLKEPVRR